MQETEDAFLMQAAPSLRQLQERFWTTSVVEEVSYPSDAQAKLAEIEEASFWFRHRNEIIAATIRRFPPAGHILDVGGGNGCVSVGLKRRGFPTIVIEPGADGASIAHARGLTVVQAAFKADMFARRVPALGLFDVIEHVADDRGFLADCYDVLMPGGYLYVTVPALPGLWSVDDSYAGHYRRYSRAGLAAALRAAQFECLYAGAFFSLLVVPLFLLRTLPSLVGLRKVDTIEQAVAHHRRGQRASMILERLHRWEIGAVENGNVVPVGTSLIAVARKPATRSA